MSVEINKVNDRQYTINGKVAQLDMNENWVCVEELTMRESEVFRKHLETEKQNNQLGGFLCSSVGRAFGSVQVSETRVKPKRQKVNGSSPFIGAN